MQQRHEEILAKKAKLAELKARRALRAEQANAGRQSMGSPGEVGYGALPTTVTGLKPKYYSSCHQRQAEQIAVAKSNLL